MDGLEQLLQQAGTAAPSAPASEPGNGPGGAAPTDPPSSPTPAGQPDADELPGGLREYLAANPDHKAAVELASREMRSAWTPKLQEAAELRRRMEGVDPTEIDQLRQLKLAEQQDPQAVARYLRERADMLHPQAPAGQDPLAGIQGATPAEEFLLKQAAEMNDWRRKQEQLAEQQSVQAFARHATTEFGRLAQEYQIAIPVEMQIQAARLAQSTGMGIEQALFAVNSRGMIDAATKKARDEAAGIVQQKTAAQAGNPGSIVAREGDAPPKQKGDFRSIMARELAERGIT